MEKASWAIKTNGGEDPWDKPEFCGSLRKGNEEG